MMNIDMKPHTKMLPNTTQIPNIIIDEWAGRLSGTEFKILIVITRQTIGWIEDFETGRRKSRDWLSMSQIELKTGGKRRTISDAVKALIEKHHLIEATDAEGNLLDTGEKRRKNFGQIFYRLTLKAPDPTLFDKPRREQKTHTEKKSSNQAVSSYREQNLRTQKLHTTKETIITKETLRADEPRTPETKEKKSKPISDHALFTRFFYDAAKATRGVTPIITGADGQMLKRMLAAGISRETLEQAATFFLSDREFKTFSPTIRTLLSAGVITGIQNRMQNQQDFWKRLDEYASRRGIQTALAGDPAKIAETTAKIAELRRNLASTMRMTGKQRPTPPHNTPAFNR